jgi:hypothetical protein
LNADLSTLSKAASEYNVSAEVAAKFTPEQTAEWQAAQQGFTQSLQAYAPLRTGVAEFSKTWDEKTAEVQALKDEVAAGKVEGDVATRVSGLQTLVTQAKEMLSGWQTAHAAAKTQTQAALDSMKGTYERLTAASTTAKK